jgi:putative membrane protein
MVGASRNLVRSVVAIGDAKIAAGVDAQLVRAFQRDVVDTQVAWCQALARHLRGTEAQTGAGGVDNPPLSLLARQSARIQTAYADGVLQGLDNFQMETALTAIGTLQAVAERIKAQPVPRQFDVFGRYFTVLFVALFPFTLVGSLTTTRWLTIPAGILVATVFGVVERAAAVTEGPFENRVQDVPLTAIATQLERDLRQLAGDTGALPPSPVPANGYLW